MEVNNFYFRKYSLNLLPNRNIAFKVRNRNELSFLIKNLDIFEKVDVDILLSKERLGWVYYYKNDYVSSSSQKFGWDNKTNTYGLIMDPVTYYPEMDYHVIDIRSELRILKLNSILKETKKI